MRPAVVPAELTRGPFTAATGRAAGLTARQLRSSPWSRLVHDVYVHASVPVTLTVRAQGVALVLPPGAAVSLTCAAWMYGGDVRDRRDGDVVEVVAAGGDQIRRRGVRASSAILGPGDVVEVHGVPVTSPVRTAFDLARRPDRIESVVGVDAMLNRGGCTLAELASYVAERRGGRGVRFADESLRQAEPLAQSPMDTRQRMRLVVAGLPRPAAQVPVESTPGRPFAYIDNGYRKWRVGADYDGEPHREQWRHDLERQERIRDQGWWHRRYTSLHITRGWP
jgi:hypothetical protein